MTIIELLKERSDNSKGDVKIDLKLYNLADDLEKKSRAHLKRIITILSEFDIHDEKHSEKVIYNIEQLLGTEKLKTLSSYELFLLHLSAFFHDCAMAPSDWEINTMKLSEGYLDFFQNPKSIKHDLKTPKKLSSAIALIKERRNELYGKFEGDVKNWMFSPKNEHELNNYLATLLVDYQNYRNGFADQIKKIKSQNDFEDLNEFIRIDYIRATHHLRIESYIKNLESLFSKSFEQPAWGKKLAHDLSLICRSHGEDANFINDFSVNSQYYGSESANLQFVAVMLRLGDIIHFSYDRAPIDLRSSRIFKSEYSFQQWAIKNSGANYSIENGKISFRAYCETPETFFKLHEYIDWIEIEIQNYFIFQRQWKKSFIENLQDKVDRTNINNDTDIFLPKRGLSFSLNQKKILELLTGVELYKDKYACLRELYQNSLDACKCMISQNTSSQFKSDGIIEFSLEKEDGKTFLCCLDNGIGMSKEVIEKYLLNVGNSFYKSSKFYKLQANWGGNFTPTSQFGIGILSCFMIGDNIEITTKVSNQDYISCSIDGPHENFYYSQTKTIEKEKIPNSGTMVRVSINDNTLQDDELNKLGLLLLGISEHIPEEFSHYKKLSENWDNHLYNKINHFVQVIPKNIKVYVNLKNHNKIEVLSKPIIIDSKNEKLEIEKDDFEFIDYLNNQRRFYPLTQKYSHIKEYLENYEIKIISNDIEYLTTLTLPTKDFYFDEIQTLYTTPQIGGYGFCIDGIYIDRSSSIGIDNYYSSALTRNGLINFIGELRPQLSVDRTSIVSYPKECEEEAEILSKNLLKEILNVSKKHIKKFNIPTTSNEIQLIWEYIFEKIGFADTLFINELALTEYGDIEWKNLTKTIEQNISIKDFLSSKKITINNFRISDLDILTEKLILSKLISSNKITINKSSVSIEANDFQKNNLIKKRNSFSEHSLLISTDNWNTFNYEYDIISNLYPLIPERLFNLLGQGYVQEINNKIKLVHSFSNGITAFFNQSPLLINEKLGLYIQEKDSFGKRKNEIYSFDKKRSSISLFELNERYFGNKKKEKYVLMVYISAKELDVEQKKELEKYKNSDSNYVKGVKEGWSLLVTSMEKENIIIKPGKSTREELIHLISDSFWKENEDCVFKFTDETEMKKQK